jgi:hypothetical protein
MRKGVAPWAGTLSSILALAAAVPAATREAGAQLLVTVDGVVHTTDGLAIASAQVTATELETGTVRRTVTTAEGRFVFVALPPGSYILTARRLGHVPVSRRLPVVIGQNAHLRFVLERAPVELPAAEVVIHAAGTGVERTSISTAVLEQEMRSLPFSTRNVMELAAVAPGIRAYRSLPLPQSRGATTIPSAGPFRDARLINLVVDGMELKNLYNSSVIGFPETGSPVPADAVREFRVLQNPYDAEYARAGVYVIAAATHRGTNEMRGSAFGTYQNGRMVSVTRFQRAIPNFSRPDYSRQQGGFSIRGPIVRDRLFYAATYEVANTLNQLPVIPGRPGSDPGIWDSYAGVFPAPNRNHTGLLRLTHSPNDRHSLDMIVSGRQLSGTTLFGSGITPSGAAVAYRSAVDQDYAVHGVNLRHVWTPSARVVNEATLQFLNWQHDEVARGGGPELQYPGLWIGRSAPHQRIRERHVRAINRVTRAMEWRGSHLLKAGVEAASATTAGELPGLAAGEFVFATDTSVLPRRARFAVGLADPDSHAEASASVAAVVLGAYVNDEWRPHPRLALTAGVRYDVELNRHRGGSTSWAHHSELSAIPELQSYLSHGKRRADVNNIAPRFAASWNILGDQRTFLRGGAGVMYDRAPRFAMFQDHREARWRIYEVLNPGTADLAVLKERIASGQARATPVFVLLPTRVRTSSTRQWSAGASRQFTRALGISVDYVQQRLENLPTLVNLNWQDASAGVPIRVLSPAYGDITAWGDDASARYRALLTHLTYQRDSTSRLSLAYTLSYSRAAWDPDVAPVPVAMKDAYYALQRTGGDERHRLVLSGFTPLPLKTAMAAIVTLASPRPYPGIVGQDINANLFLGDDWIDGSRMLRPPGIWRNWYRMVDLRVSRPLTVSDGLRVSVVAEAFNVFNTQNYAGFRGQQRDASGQERADFGKPGSIFATRQFQLGTRIDFQGPAVAR